MSLLTTIKVLCVEKNTTLSALEKTLGFGNGSISKWDGAVPSGDRLAKVADYFGVTVDYLLGRTDNKKAPDKSGVGDIYFSLAKELEDAKIDPEDIRNFAKIIEKNMNKS